MAATFAKRSARLLMVLFAVSVGTFLLVELAPGDPAIVMLGDTATPEQIAALRTELGLDKPPHQRYVEWLAAALTGDLGTTLQLPRRPVADLLMSRLPVTLQLATLSLLLSLAIAVPLAMRSSLRAGGAFDRTVSAGTFALISVPNFVAALLLIWLFVFHPDLVRIGGLLLGVGAAMVLGIAGLRRRTANPEEGAGRLFSGGIVVVLLGLMLFLWLPDLPRQGFVRVSDGGIGANLRSVFLPVLTLSLVDVAIFTRLLRSDMIVELQKPYIEAARARGMPTRHVLLREALRPSLFSLVTVLVLSLGALIGGAVIVEEIFRLPGIGRLLVEGARNGDYPVVQATVLLIAAIYVLGNAAVDFAYSLLDPRVRRRSGAMT